MDYFERKVKKGASKEKPPSWVDKKNKSYQAWLKTEELKADRLLYIKNNTKQSAFRKKGSYQITGAEVARSVGMDNSTLLNTSAYSTGYREYLNKINEDLSVAKDSRITKAEQNRGRGAAAKPKDELVKLNKQLNNENDRLRELLALSRAEETFNKLDLDVKRKLMMKVVTVSNNINKINK